jgi:hypothetical protein
MSKNNSSTSTAPSTEAEATTPVESNQPLTPYAAHKLVNQALEAANVTKRIPPQMMYNYTSGRLSKGKEPFITFDPKNGVDRESLTQWIEKYVAKQVASVTPTEAPADES